MGAGQESGEERLEAGLQRALAYLARRDRTEAQVRRRLEADGIDSHVVPGVLERLQDLGYVDDERFARTYAEDRRTLDGWGSERIARGLSEAGVHPDLVASMLETRPRDEELAGALEVLDRRLVEAPSDDREREKALGLLVRRGYELDLAYDAVRAFERRAA